MSFFNKFLRILTGCGHKTSRGQIVLAHGKHEVEIKTHCHPCKIFVSSHCCEHQTCGGDVCKTGTIIIKHGFILIADVHCNSCTIDWLVECR